MPQPMGDEPATHAIASLHHAWITGLILTIINRRDAGVAEEFVFRLFRRQHVEKFLPGLTKLGLASEPHAVAAAKYHYFSNQLGGVNVEYFEESAQKAWVRYPPPRWIWMDTAICAIPTAVNRAMLRGWHAHNGVTLGNPRLGFVCTKTSTDGQPGLEGYYIEHDHAIDADARLLFRPEESAPRIDPSALPRLDAADWPAARRAKAYRNYAMEYLRNGLPLLSELVGPEEARFLGRLSGLQIGMQCHRAVAASLRVLDDSADAFVELFAQLARAQGDSVESEGSRIRLTSWRLFRDLPTPHESVFDGWSALWEGLLLAHNRFLRLRPTQRLDRGDGCFEWVIEPNPRG